MTLTVLLIPFIGFGFIMCVLFLFIVGIVALVRSLSPRHSGTDATDEARMIQEIHQGLRGLEERTEALETILLEKERPNAPSGGREAVR